MSILKKFPITIQDEKIWEAYKKVLSNKGFKSIDEGIWQQIKEEVIKNNPSFLKKIKKKLTPTKKEGGGEIGD